MPLCSISSCLNSTSDTHDRRPNGEPYRMCASCREKWRVKAVQRKGGVKRPRVKRERVGVWSWAPEEARNIGEMDEDEEVNGDDNVADADGEPDWESQGEDESEDGEQDGADADDVSESELELSLGSGSGGSSTLVNTSAPTRNRQDSRVIDVDSTNDESDNDNDDIAALRKRYGLLHRLFDAMWEMKTIEERLKLLHARRQRERRRWGISMQGARDKSQSGNITRMNDADSDSERPRKSRKLI